MPPEVQSVWQLVRYLRDLLDHDRRLADVWVGGEVSNLTRASSGHIYFTLKDRGASMRCVFFRTNNAGQGDRLEMGASLIVHGKVGVFEQRGELQFVVDFVQPAGVGARQAEFERRRALFEEEGLFDPGRKRRLPRFPERIGVVTSMNGAAMHDVRTVLGRRWPRAAMLLQPAQVQGDLAAVSIAEAVRGVAPKQIPADWPDLVIVTRGGGASEDLWAFNEEPVVRAIFSCPVPVISAVGHETDTTLADLVADLRAPTPSAAAELATPDRLELQQQVRQLLLRQQMQLNRRVTRLNEGVARDVGRLDRSLPNTQSWHRRISAYADAMRHRAVAATASSRDGTTALAARLETLSPLATLDRGYALVAREDGSPVGRASDLETGDAIEIQWRDGSRQARVESGG
ncbi:MAG: exodeoxyribonuclease VII large subunit [Chloroflexi bacterium]|nr:exodeoxyribonuclease VII large subunit [Chloroflexota bacterium]MDA1146474.1 exodeoxyribonuclease VII large subunit [Chloroflexota bacterium]PKB56647.1 MAG: exodeoxyribonuclease VII large subunit [SAR202 cluster bacterium Casp-Chloro-G1]